MKAMILAAGRGQRMRELTSNCPKPLIKLNKKTLIERHIEKLANIGITEIVINISYLAHQIINFLGYGDKWNVKITYSHEIISLETGGGICRALHLLSDVFIVINADVFSNIDYQILLEKMKSKKLCHLFLIKNPNHNLKGDFSLDKENNIYKKTEKNDYTFMGISVYKKEFFKDYEYRKLKNESFRMLEVWQNGIKQNTIYGTIYNGLWCDVGTPERLKSLSKKLKVNDKN